MKPVLLDLYCGAGGAAMGYHRSGFDVIGVDNKPQPHYPFAFVQGDVFDVFDGLAASAAAIHASPPCQAYSRGAVRFRNEGKAYPDLLAATRTMLQESGLPWVIENVPGAPMRPDLRICGCQVGLDEIRRVRWFETSWHAFALVSPCAHDPGLPILSITGHGNPTWARDRWRAAYGGTPRIADYKRAMGISWMNRDELSQAIPPAYTALVGAHLLAQLPAAIA